MSPSVTKRTGVLAMLIVSCLWGQPGWAGPAHDKKFSAVVTDAKGLETEVKNVIFYWEEKVGETAFVPHALRHVPVKRGAATLNVRFETIKQIEVTPGQDGGMPLFTVVLTSGKSGEFALAIAGAFKGETEFGEAEFPAGSVKKLVFK